MHKGNSGNRAKQIWGSGVITLAVTDLEGSHDSRDREMLGIDKHARGGDVFAVNPDIPSSAEPAPPRPSWLRYPAQCKSCQAEKQRDGRKGSVKVPVNPVMHDSDHCRKSTPKSCIFCDQHINHCARTVRYSRGVAASQVRYNGLVWSWPAPSRFTCPRKILEQTFNGARCWQARSGRKVSHQQTS